MPTYRNFCIENGYICKNNQLKLTAEVLYRFISGNDDFVEHHKGIDDVMIEQQVSKRLVDGQVIIIRGNKQYTLLGQSL